MRLISRRFQNSSWRHAPCHALQPLSRCRRYVRSAKREEPAGEQPQDSRGITSVEEASRALESFFSSLGKDGSQALMDWAPDAALDAMIDARKQAGVDITSLTAQDMCEFHHGAQAGTLQFSIDSYAMRVLLWDTPRVITPLSALAMAPEKSIHRFEVSSVWGEQVTLTVVVEKQDTLQPQYRSSPRIERTWRLRTLSGEALDDCADIPLPSPSVGPELVVAAQLAALRAGDVARVFMFASPENQAVTGPLERFESMLQGPQFRPLLHHSETNSLRRVMYNKDAYFELVAISISVPGQGADTQLPKQHWLYLWDVQRQGAEGAGGAWMTQSVQLVSATNSVYRPGAPEDIP